MLNIFLSYTKYESLGERVLAGSINTCISFVYTEFTSIVRIVCFFDKKIADIEHTIIEIVIVV